MRRYLFVDDNVAFAENLAEIVGDDGHEVTVVAGGPQALRLVTETRFDVLVTDIRMPVMNGAKLVHEIRRVDPGLPAMAITAYTSDADLLAAREEGLLVILPKPVPIERFSTLLFSARRDGIVALVEDDEALADNLTELLRDRGFSTVSARSVAETDRLGGVRPFAAIVDLRLPGGSDGAALDKLLQRIPDLPTIVISAHGSSAGRRVDFPKPFETSALLAEVEKLWR